MFFRFQCKSFYSNDPSGCYLDTDGDSIPDIEVGLRVCMLCVKSMQCHIIFVVIDSWIYAFCLLVLGFLCRMLFAGIENFSMARYPSWPIS